MRILIIFFIPVLALIISNQSFSQELLSLEEAVKISLTNNYSINIAKNDSRIAGNNVTPGNAGFLPTVGVSGAYIKSSNDTKQGYFDGRTINQADARATNITAGINLDWTIFDGLQMFANLDMLKELNRIGTDNFRSEVEKNIAQVIETYYNLIMEKLVLDVLNQAIGISEERVRIAESKKDVGTGSKFDLRQAQVDLNEDRSNLLKEELTYEQLKVTLNQLMGREVSSDFSVSDTIIVNNNLSIDTLKNQTIEKNTTLRIAKKDLNLSEINLRIARSELFPEISLVGGYNYTKSESQAGFIESNRNYSLNYGVSASLNLFNGFNTRRKIENAQIGIESSQLNFEQVKTGVEAELLNTYKKYLNSLRLVELEEENLKVAQESVDIALEKLKLGNITPLEFRETQRKLIDAKSRLVSAQFDAKSAETELLRISGQLIKTD
ncbi:MAG TPA: TolC family protein [Ignavibacteriaceae bacterium]|nr:TolC family protein [Ignavibacteriaceae bacterium]